MASLLLLPAPLPLLIAKLLPDLKALDALRKSCGLFATVSTLHAVELLGHLMLATLHAEVVVEVRALILVLASQPYSNASNGDTQQTIRERASLPLDNGTPVEAIFLAIQTFSFLHSLCYQVATRKLAELYALPHQHATSTFGPHSTNGTGLILGGRYHVTPPSPPHWVEEQRMLRSLFHLRSLGLLGRDLAPPTAVSGNRFWNEQFSLVHECRHLFDDHLEQIMHGLLPQQLDWRSPAPAPNPESDSRVRWVGEDFRPAFEGPTKLADLPYTVPEVAEYDALHD
ncbi:hypothetical protein LTR17_023073 [Elasticomyces elasticus]|nr:hypothetical protein LTR17_023073 [Elasticomyces elasticus]